MNTVSADAPVAVIARRRSLQVKAIQFTRGRGAEVAAFARSAHDKVQARNGGTYVTINDFENSLRVRIGDWLVLDADGELRKYDTTQFAKLFSSK